MKNCYLKAASVPIPRENPKVVIRNGKAVEFETERVYSPEKKDTRVKRVVIGK